MTRSDSNSNSNLNNSRLSLAVLSAEQMVRAERQAIAAGTTEPELMHAAGRAVAKKISELYESRTIAILCGPGNNGGDGKIVAELLIETGAEVKKFTLEDLTSPSISGSGFNPNDFDLVIDGLFGTGLSRPIEGQLAELFAKLNSVQNLPLVAIDIPSGINATTGEVMGAALKANHTVTFYSQKLGHLILPGRSHCGEVHVADIGISLDYIHEIDCKTYENSPTLWQHKLPQISEEAHKYDRGSLSVIGDPHMTGASRLALRAARRVGVGHTRLFTDLKHNPEAGIIYSADSPGVIIQPLNELSEGLNDKRTTAALLGPGLPPDQSTRNLVSQILNTGKPMVLDAGGLMAYKDRTEELAQLCHEKVLITPHEGEFSALFPNENANALERAQKASRTLGCQVLLKGPTTVIASPEGWVLLSTNGPKWLATAGTGDVLAGLAAGLIAQGMEVFWAAGMAAWLLGEAANTIGPGLIAEDIPEQIPILMLNQT